MVIFDIEWLGLEWNFAPESIEGKCSRAGLCQNAAPAVSPCCPSVPSRYFKERRDTDSLNSLWNPAAFRRSILGRLSCGIWITLMLATCKSCSRSLWSNEGLGSVSAESCPLPEPSPLSWDAVALLPLLFVWEMWQWGGVFCLWFYLNEESVMLEQTRFMGWTGGYICFWSSSAVRSGEG